MKIGFDAKRLFNNPTGLGNYARTLIRQLHEHYPSLEIVLFVPKVKANEFNQWFLDQSSIKIVEATNAMPAWRSFGLVKAIKQEKLDIYHGLSNELPLRAMPKGVKSVVTIHDLIFKVFTKQYSFVDRQLYNYKSAFACRKADQVIAISKHTKSDIEKFYGQTKRAIEVVYQSCRPYKPALNPSRDYFLFVSSINKRKGLVDILKAMHLQKPDERSLLKVVGTGGAYQKELEMFVQKKQLSSWVKWMGNINNNQLEDLYRHAIALIYPSQYEGFGIPIIESLSTHTPVITSNVSSMPEAGGNQAMYVEPGNPANLKEAMGLISSWQFDALALKNHLKLFDAKEVTDILVNNYSRLLP